MNTTVYNILDLKAVLKHAFFSAGNADADAQECPITSRKIPTWEFAAQHVLTRYEELFFGEFANPRFTLVAQDMGHEFRSAVYEGYKQKRDQREKSELETENFGKLMQWFNNFMASLGATQVGVQGVEADDVIAWLCENLEGFKNVFTVDADLLQLAKDDTFIYLKNDMYTDSEKDGIPLHLTSIAKSLLGDKSDEYGGVPGFGPVKFQHLLSTYGEDGILQLQEAVDNNDTTLLDQAIEQTGDKTLIILRDNFELWRRMWKLAQLHPELCWKPRARKLVKPTWHKRVPNGNKVYNLLKMVGADDLWPKFEPMMPRAILIDSTNWEGMRGAIFDEIVAGDVVAFDYETANKNPHQPFNEVYAGRGDFVDMLNSELTGASFQFGKYLENVIYVTVDHAEANNLPASVVGEILKHSHANSRLVAHNFYFEGIISRTNLGMTLDQVHDTQIMQRYVDENEEYGLKSLSKNTLGYQQASYTETLNGKTHMAELTTDEVFTYATDDSLVTGVLYDLLKVKLMMDGTWDFYREWAVDSSCVLQSSYVAGVRMDKKAQKNLHERDVEIVRSSIEQLREVLTENCTGEITKGCESYIEAEQEYVRKGHNRKLRDEKGLKADELKKAVSSKLYEWRTKFERACRYTPFHVEEVMPAAKVTPTTMNKALDVLGLDPIEKMTQKAVADYLAAYGMMGAGDENLLPDYDDQREFLNKFADFVSRDGLRISTLNSQYDKAVDQGKDSEALAKLHEKLQDAEDAYESFGVYLQKVSGVEPSIVKTGDELSLNSPAQMLQLLYCKIGVPVRLRSTGTLSQGRMKLGMKENGPATDEKAIQTALANDVEKGSWQDTALRLLLKAKSAQTRIGLYHKPYPMWQHPKDGKWHPSFTLCGTDTRRPTGSSPNMLQVPKKSPEMRDLFLPPTDDHVVVAIDYASQEIRIMACEADDPVMKSVYNPEDEKDLHSMTGSGIAKMDYRSFVEAYEDPDHELHKFVKEVRGKKAKACIAEGSLVLTDKGMVPIEKITVEHKVWDGLEWVSHEGVINKGRQQVISHCGLTATPDHEVYLDDGRSEKFGVICQRAASPQPGQPGLMVGETEGLPIRVSGGSCPTEGEGRDGNHPVHPVRGTREEVGVEPRQGVDTVPVLQEVGHSRQESAGGEVLRHSAEMHEPEESFVPELRGQRDNGGVQVTGRICGLGAQQPTSPRLQGSGLRQEEQQSGLQQGESQAGEPQKESFQYAEEQGGAVPESGGDISALVAPSEVGSPGIHTVGKDNGEALRAGEDTGRDHCAPQEAGWATVYDIVNAGPRHRFTVSGVVVSNCNFGLAYGAGAGTLSRNLIAPLAEAKSMLDDAFELYARIKPWQEETAQFMTKHGYTINSFGTKRHATDDLFNKDKGKVARMHRQGTNATIQGTAAEMLQMVLTNIWRSGMLDRLNMVFFAPIYDEVVSFVHKDDVVAYCREMHKIMSDATPPGHEIPQVPEFSVGLRWGQLTELGRWPGEEAIETAVDKLFK